MPEEKCLPNKIPIFGLKLHRPPFLLDYLQHPHVELEVQEVGVFLSFLHLDIQIKYRLPAQV